MHEVFLHLAKRVGAAHEGLLEVIRELEAQSERETTTLEQAAYGEEFDAELAPIQEKVVAALQEAMELLYDAEANAERARDLLRDIREL